MRVGPTAFPRKRNGNSHVALAQPPRGTPAMTSRLWRSMPGMMTTLVRPHIRWHRKKRTLGNFTTCMATWRSGAWTAMSNTTMQTRQYDPKGPSFLEWIKSLDMDLFFPHPGDRVYRGGSYSSAPMSCRSATRRSMVSVFTFQSIGFRVATDLSDSSAGQASIAAQDGN